MLVDLFEACNRGGNEKRLTFQANIPKGLSAAAIDKNLMRVAVNNLLTNAIKYSDDNGKVTLTAEETEKTVCISVRDEGIGISEEDKEHIFDKFRRGETDDVRARAGHGLGLALAREIVLLHEGTLTFTSELGSGSEFTIEISKETNLLKKVG